MPLNSVLITGAGPAGLTLAQYLKTHHVPFRIIEKASESRLQGYSVTLHFGIPYITQAMGQEKMDGFAEKTSVLYTDVTGFATVTADGEILIQTRGTPTIVGTGFRANRSRLRQFLLDGLDLETGVEVTGVEFPSDGVVIAKSNKGDIMADIIVGADGLHSSIRQSIIGDKVEELTIMNLSGSTHITAEQYKAFAKYSPTHAMVHGTKLPGKEGVANIFFGINDFSKDNNTYHMRWVISWDRALIYNDIPNTNAGLHEFAQEIASQFCEPFKSIVQETDPTSKIWLGKVCQYMPDPSWNGNGKVTLIGDALHSMTPYRGEGLNHAMIDIVQLGEQLVKAHHDEITIAEAIAAYEAEAIPRGKRAVQASYESAYQLHEGFSWLVTRITKLFGLTLYYSGHLPFLRFFFPKTH
ncbi:hypothetical protein K450DRAFT_247415 [Umbelopsis ramanniana AG]|uniref:FAD-binding domain-containing protein n=1 Tax=Umbelopsis ramanniana AG TaxID=1314678 RepID=A0AAD5HBS4_UMBRA|nr:uncharacterized protein K450DRAFT_247415 [Umbelopsis ramanniana AG]KAI8578327.1 hypothetical protein K450DRAFT_247415 [Umbelopsis ramanniana AG]